jgi:CRISPR-associated protein Cas1
VEDRIVERAVLGELDRAIDPLLSPWSFAYRRGLGVKDAVRAVVAARDAGHTWFVRADFDGCFDRIPRWPVIERVREVVPDGDLVALVQALVNRSVAGAGRGPTGFGLHQGSGLSPILANLYLDAFDRAMIGRGYPVYRYADDLPARRPTGQRRNGSWSWPMRRRRRCSSVSATTRAGSCPSTRE